MLSLVKQYSIDKDQKDTLKSTCLIIVVAFILSLIFKLDRFLVLIVLPLQFVTTFFIFANKTTMKGEAFIDHISRKKVMKATGDKLRLLTAVSLIPYFSVILGYGKLELSEYILIFLPLLLTRTFIFVSKLPLSSLYSFTRTNLSVYPTDSLNTFHNSKIHSIERFSQDDDRYNPTHSFRPDNIFHNINRNR